MPHSPPQSTPLPWLETRPGLAIAWPIPPRTAPPPPASAPDVPAAARADALARAWAERGLADLLATLAAPRGAQGPVPREVTLLGSEALAGEALAGIVRSMQAAAAAGGAEPPLLRIARDWSRGDPASGALAALAATLQEPDAPLVWLHGIVHEAAALEGPWLETLAGLAERGWPLSAEVWLLAGRNDDVERLRALLRRLMALRVRPHYLVLGEWLPGALRVPEARALELVHGLRGWISGLAAPQLLHEDAWGRRELLVPEYVESIEAERVTVRDYAGRQREYLNPRAGRGREA